MILSPSRASNFWSVMYPQSTLLSPNCFTLPLGPHSCCHYSLMTSLTSCLIMYPCRAAQWPIRSMMKTAISPYCRVLRIQ
jgi:hypothetical protein